MAQNNLHLRGITFILILVFGKILVNAQGASSDSDRVIVLGNNYEQVYLDSLEKTYQKLKSEGKIDSNTLSIALELTNKYGQLTPEKGLAIADGGLELAVQMRMEAYSSNFYAAKGLIYRQKGYLDLALHAFQKALLIVEKYNLKQILPFSLIDIGNIYYDQKEYDKALNYYQAAATRTLEEDRGRGQAVALNNIAIVYRQKGDFKRAMTYFKKGAQARINSGEHILLGHSFLYISNIFLRLNELDSAFNYAKQAIDSLGKYKVWNEYAWGNVTYGRVLYAKGDYDAGDEAFDVAKKKFSELGFLLEINEINIIHANQKLKRGQVAEAIAMLKKELQIAEETKNLDLSKKACSSLYEYFKSVNNSKEALIYLEKLIFFERQSNDQEMERNLADMELKFLLNNKESELLKSKESLVQQQEFIDNIEWRNRFLIGLSFLSLVVLIGLIWAVYQKSKNNRMLISQNEIIERQNIEIQGNLSVIEKAKAETEKLLRAKSEFLSHMSHEIRTPMNSILGLTDMLLEDVTESKSYDKLQSIKYAADVLLVIIDDVLDIASIEEGKIGIHIEQSNLGRMFRELENNLAFKAKSKNIRLEFALASDLPKMIQTDQTRLFQVLMNLVSNAIKFTKKGHVKLSCHVLKRDEKSIQLRFKVTDTGIGIPIEQQASIFESFHQGGKGIQRTYGGTGLGLTITRRLLELFDSEIKLKSMPGVGSEFSFDMHFDLSAAEPSQEKIDNKLPEKELEGLNLLYVEDNEMNQKVMSLLLGRAKIQLDFAFNGEEGLKMLQENDYDGVLMDFHMPIMDGLSCTRAIRSGEVNTKNPNIPIIGITADVFEESAHEGMVSGMNTTIKKPINKRELFNALSTFCKRT